MWKNYYQQKKVYLKKSIQNIHAKKDSAETIIEKKISSKKTKKRLKNKIIQKNIRKRNISRVKIISK